MLNAYDAMVENAPILHERLLTLSSPAFRVGAYGDSDTEKGTNVANHFEFRLGDVEKGFQEADIVVEGEYRTKGRPPRLHRTSFRRCQLERRWKRDHLVQ